MDKAYALKEELAKNFRTTIDDSDKGPGFKFAEAEMRGIPVRIEVGPKDIEAGQAVIVRRDTREKITVSFEELSAKVGEVLETMQKEMLERARAHRDAHTYTATNYEEFKDILANKPGFVKAMWCGDRACEDKVKEELSATSRCMPFEQEELSDVCVCCGKKAKKSSVKVYRVIPTLTLRVKFSNRVNNRFVGIIQEITCVFKCFIKAFFELFICRLYLAFMQNIQFFHHLHDEIAISQIHTHFCEVCIFNDFLVCFLGVEYSYMCFHG